MITAIFLAIVFYAFYRLFMMAEDVYVFNSVSLQNFDWKKFALMVGVPFVIAFVLFMTFKSKIKFK